MAYLHKNDIVIISGRRDSIHARVVDVRFRRFRRSAKEMKLAKNKSRWKSVPYAVCEAFIGAVAGTEFLIPGYKLRNIEKNGEKLLVLRDEYIAEFDGAWVEKLLAESKEKRSD